MFYFALGILFIFRHHMRPSKSSRSLQRSLLRSGNKYILSNDSNEEKEKTVVLSTYLRGGLGNQIQGLLQTLAITHRSNLEFSMPMTIRRFKQKLSNNPPSYPLQPSSLFWNTMNLSKIARMSKENGLCNGSIHIYYFLSRSERTLPISKQSVSNYALLEICYQAGLYSDGHVSKDCADKVFTGTTFISRMLPLTFPADDSFLVELAAMKYGILPSGVKIPPHSALCVFLDGSSYSRAGHIGTEYLFSYMHYLEPSARVVDIFDKMVNKNDIDKNKLAVMHLRFDEHLCFHDKGIPKVDGKICIRTRLKTNLEDTIYWAGVSEVIESVYKIMKTHNVDEFYLAASPYSPSKVVLHLLFEMKKRVKVITSFDNHEMGHETLNMLERELAVESKIFIGDYASTWSTSVYYKRRTIYKESFWCAGLCNPDAQFVENIYLAKPNWFERQDNLKLHPLPTDGNKFRGAMAQN